MQYRQRHNAGLTLVEMLVVVAIVAILTATAIPVIARNGLLGGSKVSLAVQETFTILRAAQVYATTNNIETAVLYVSTPLDSTNPNTVRDSFIQSADPGDLTLGIVPVVDSLVIGRRLTDREVIDLGFGNNINTEFPIFVPLSGPDGLFRKLPNNMCILPDLFEWEGNVNGRTATGLQPVWLYDKTTLNDPQVFGIEALFEPREEYDPAGDNNTANGTFPAHIFTPEGQVEKGGMVKERAILRIGNFPNTLITERFTDDPGEIPNLATQHTVLRSIRYNDVTTLDDVPIYLDALREDSGSDDIIDSLEIDSQIEIYFSIGRIRVRS